MRSIVVAALGLASLTLLPVWVGAGCAAGTTNQTSGTTSGSGGHGGSGGGTTGSMSTGGSMNTGGNNTGGSMNTGGSNTGGAMNTGGSGGTGGMACVPSEEVCDGIDNDCDGVIDTPDCLCKNGDTQTCYTGDPSTLGIGVCHGGTQTCNLKGQWGECEGEVIPSTEVCDGLDNDCDGSKDEDLGSTTCGKGICQVTIDNCINGQTQTCTPGEPLTEKCNGADDNCDGTVDEGCLCLDGSQQSCYTGPPNTLNVGECKPGTQICNGGQWGPCENQTVPDVETCNAKDDDCDGTVDDGLGTSVCGVGACQMIVPNCQGGIVQTCVPGQPSAEVCDGKDNDCNGTVDDGLGTITCGIGACVNTVASCKNGQPNVCNPLPPQVEVCDGIDNNCNGAIDDGDPGGGGACTTGQQGVCAAGTQHCVSGSIQCVQNVQPSVETCDNKDNDCNGVVDNGNPGGGVTCNTGLQGVCSAGTTACTNGAIVCNQNVQSSAEICDAKDNDCNGAVDEGNPGGGLTCDTGKQGACAAGTTACVSGSIVCNQNVSPTGEVCDGIDNNCNGTVDEGNPGGGLACNTSLQGVCQPGTTACSNGAVVCNQNVQPSAEICDGKDNDCNGMVDDGNPGGGQACNTNKLGVCAAGTTACSNGSIACNQNVQPSAEVCDGLDNNCDGQVDEGVKTTYYRDADGDGYGNSAITTQACTQPAGYVTVGGDCNDSNPAIHPGATEACNGIDDNCNGTIDEGVKTTYFADADGDGFGNASVTTQACSQPAGYVTNSNDCNDAVASVHPGATETCNGVDDNCNGTIDEGVKNTYYADADGDGFGNPAVTAQACTQPAGFVTNSTDCNDTNNAIRPGAPEVCNNVDDNCNGSVDEGNPGGGVACGACNQGTTLCSNGALSCQNPNTGLATYYRDADGDGFGNAAVTTQACSLPTGYVTNATDCNDTNMAVFPGATETCNGIDDNCNGMVDEGNPGGGVACTTNKPGICNPGTTACTSGALVCNQNAQPSAEVCDGLDNNCDGTVDEGVKNTYYRDADGDGFGNPSVTTQACTQPTGYVTNNTDCNDSNNAVKPGATETCNGVDDNCNGTIDEGVKNTYFADADGDGFGNPAVTTQACTQPAGYVTNATDCNDTNNAIRPGAPELCNNVDDNCNGTVDEGNPGGGVGCGSCNLGTTQCSSGALTCLNPNTGLATYYRDADGDTFGNAAVTTQACSQPAGYVTNATDCNDNNASVKPGATEVCNGIDDNCNGATDEGNPGGGVACTTGKSGVCSPGTTACTSGSVVCNQNVQPSAETCDSKDNDCDGQVDNNAITADGLPNSCATASNKVVAVAPGTTSAAVTGYIDPNGEDWFVVNFTGVPGTGGYFHPKISFTSNPGTQFKLEVFSSCGTLVNTGGQCTPSNLDTFEMLYQANQSGCNNTNGGFTCSDNVGRSTSFIVHVKRVSGAPFTCTPYSITASNL
ncbi:Type IV fimbrial biogenesis protein PilY1 [Minicystis rosea]|nr:Type IV fimbrial biogenesis protein PilY1 [Minicystis rosea]